MTISLTVTLFCQFMICNLEENIDGVLESELVPKSQPP